jgi:hypothetical protein
VIRINLVVDTVAVELTHIVTEMHKLNTNMKGEKNLKNKDNNKGIGPRTSGSLRDSIDRGGNISKRNNLRDDANAGREGSKGFISSGDLRNGKGQARNCVSRCAVYEMMQIVAEMHK